MSTDLVTDIRATQNAQLNTLNASNGALLTSLITAASKAIRNYCRRDFNSQSYTEYHHGAGYPYQLVQLRQYPVLTVSRVGTDPEPAVRIFNRTSTNTRATVAVTSTGLVLTREASGVSTPTTFLFASYATVTLLTAAVNALGNGWTATVQGSYGGWGTTHFRPLTGAASALVGSGVPLEVYVEDRNEWRLDDGTGELWGNWPRGELNVRIDYTAGFATVPEDVQEACVQYVVSIYNAGLHDANLKSETLGPYSKTLADGGGMAMPAVCKMLLAPYVCTSNLFGRGPR